MDFFTMTRRGIIKPKRPTSNQCKEPEHLQYYYELKIVFHGHTPLDKHDFIVEHSELDKVLQKGSFSGSCERMHMDIRDSLHKFFEKKKLGFYMQAFKCTLYPSRTDITDGAFMSCIYVGPGNSEVIGLLQ